MNPVNSRIAKNTVLLYIRLFITVLVGLYTSRVILSVLGASDYGVYNVVGGIVAMLSFLNSAMVAASQRFLSFELGKDNHSDIKKVFSTSFYIHLTIAILVLMLAEVIGVWFVNTQLNIPDSRMHAANWVFQSSIVIFLLTIITVPYNACVIAHEHMNVFAIVSIVEACLKLGLVLLLQYVATDKLVLYSLLMILVSFSSCSVYFIYSKIKFEECKRLVRLDKNKYKEMFSFAGWNIFGNIGSSFKEQCVSIVINIFCGTVVNAARGIATQVNTIVNSFAANIIMAINPQITKQYASGDITGSMRLVYACAKYSFFMLMLIAIPVFININYLLRVWLVEVPEFSASFLIVILLVSLIYSLTAPVTTALQATGRIKAFQIGVCLIMMIDVPAAYMLLKFGYSPVIAVIPSLLTNTLALIYRFFLIKKYIPQYNTQDYYVGVVLRCLLIFTISFILCYLTSKLFQEGVIRLIFASFIAIIEMCFIIYFLGLSKQEREEGKEMIYSRVHLIKTKL